MVSGDATGTHEHGHPQLVIKNQSIKLEPPTDNTQRQKISSDNAAVLEWTVSTNPPETRIIPISSHVGTNSSNSTNKIYRLNTDDKISNMVRCSPRTCSPDSRHLTFKTDPIPTSAGKCDEKWNIPITAFNKKIISSERREKEFIKYNISHIPPFVRNLAFLDRARFLDRELYNGRKNGHNSKSRNAPSTEEPNSTKTLLSLDKDSSTADLRKDTLTRTTRNVTKDDIEAGEINLPRSNRISFDEGETIDERQEEFNPVDSKPHLIEHQDGKSNSGYQFCKNTKTRALRHADNNIKGTPNKSQKNFSLMEDSRIWVPQSREDWENCTDEMAKLCAYAAYRWKKTGPVLPKLYIEERIDIDDPLRGFQIRHRTGGWLQGFIMMTTFTTWQYYFKWDSLHPKSGMTSTPPSSYTRSAWDTDGLFSKELEAQPRSGDPNKGGVVWPSIAEISVVGGIGCGEYLLRMALDDISRQGRYKYVVLQATETSRSFYEKFGFKRVGAVTKYGREKKRKHPQVVGYRHWTYADEKHLRVHGGPSYMMARRVVNIDSENDAGKVHFSFLDALSEYFVHDKPTVIPRYNKNHVADEEMSRFLCTTSEKMPCDSNSQSIANSYDSVYQQINLNKTNTLGSCMRISIPKEVKKSPERTQQRKRNFSITNSPTQVNKRIRFAIPVTPTKDFKKEEIEIEKSPLKLQRVCEPKDQVLRKQKVTHMRRSPKPLFFNKVVARKGVERTVDCYHFVIHYDDEAQNIRIVKLEIRGKFTGKREGRTKWRAKVDKINLSSLDFPPVPCKDWDVIPATMVTKTSVVADESWDILE